MAVNHEPLTLEDLPEYFNYCGSADHPRHRFVEVSQPMPHPVATLGEFEQLLRRAAYIVYPSPARQVRVGTAWVVGLAPGSFPSASECDAISAALVRSHGWTHYVYWYHAHVGGAWDLHLLSPKYDLDQPLVSVRNRREYSLARARHAVDDMLKRLNAVRQAEDPKAPLLRLEKVRTRKTPEVRDQIEAVVGPIQTFRDLKAALAALGLDEDEWEFDLQGRLVLWRYPGGNRRLKRPVRISIPKLHVQTAEKTISPQQRNTNLKDRALRNTRPFPDR